MHRHLEAARRHFEIVSAHSEYAEASDLYFDPIPKRPLFLKLHRSRWRRWAQGLDALAGIAVSYRKILTAIAARKPDLLVAVAEFPVFIPAVRAARKAGIPIIAIVHDWSPAWLDFPRKLRPLANRRFRRTCQNCTITLSVSPELAAEFGGGWRHRVLYPIPGGGLDVARAPVASRAFQIIYAGIFHYFHSHEVADLCRELLKTNRSDLLRLYGPEPDWNAETARPVRDGNFYGGMVGQSEIPPLLSNASALLVICPFADSLAEFSRFSFPSKLTEYCRFGRPIVLWAPPESAAVKWAEHSKAARIVTDRDASSVLQALIELEHDSQLCERYSAAARNEAATTFQPERLNRIFLNALTEVFETASKHSFHRDVPLANAI